MLHVEDLPGVAAALSEQGVPFRDEAVEGPGRRQILCEDPIG